MLAEKLPNRIVSNSEVIFETRFPSKKHAYAAEQV